jgi:sterol desaturase/sphingolipid hydroxylase (fatty acid hydroxylase superfamily)
MLMQLNWMASAIPLFLFFIVWEYFASKRKGHDYFHFSESIANLNVGIGERLSDLCTTGLFYFVFDYVYRHYALLAIKPTVITWFFLFLLTDFLWYWYHRFAHTINLFWSAHIVHHQSEDFNYTVSTRITVFQAIIRCAFWSTMPLVGFPPQMIVIFLLIHGAYPFFTHTQTIGKLGWLEYIFVTPSHHRVHHASNTEYLDKNYGDILIVWDKMFGTFVKETVQPKFGLTSSLNSYSFLWQHFHYFLELIIAVKREKKLSNKIKLVFGKPELIDTRIRLSLERKLLKRQLTSPTKEVKQYILFQTVFTLVTLFLLVLLEHYLTSTQLCIAALFIVTSIINTGALLEKQHWIIYLEIVRLTLLILFINNYYFNLYFFSICSLLIMLVLFYTKSIKKWYTGLLYGQKF